MKKALLSLFVMVAAFNVGAQNAKEIAAALLQQYTQLADGSYMQMNKQKFSNTDTISQYDVPGIIQANKAQFSNYRDALEYTLTFYRNNPLAVKTGKEIIKALKIIGDKEGFTFARISDETYILYKGAEEIMEYSQEQYVNIYPNEYLFLYIYANPPYSYYLADEKNYNGHYPTIIKNTRTPQIVQLTDGNHTVIMNGIFESGKLTGGSFKLSGFDKFRDGSWFSRNWMINSITEASFLPEGTTDTILGYVRNLDFLNFEPHSHLYYEYNKKNVSVLKSNIPWLKNIYEQSEGHRPGDDSRLYANAASLEKVTAGREAKEHNTGLPDAAVKILDDGQTYVGGFANNLPEGEGVLTSKEGTTYRGKWHQGVPVGEIKIHYLPKDDLPAGDYAGGFKNGKWEGQGVYTTADGTVSGNFHSGLLNGHGSKKFVKNNETETGEYVNGLQNGTIEYSNNEEIATYTYANGILNGPAQIHYNLNEGNTNLKGFNYSGNYKNGEKDGVWKVNNSLKGNTEDVLFVNGEHIEQNDHQVYSGQPVNNNRPNKPIPSNVNSNRITERNCPRCNGSGRVISTDNGGYQTTVTCSLCKGTGKVH